MIAKISIAALSFVVSIGCKPIDESCLSSGGSAADGNAPFANEVLGQQTSNKFQLVKTGSRDQSGAMLAFLSGSLQNGLVWQQGSGSLFAISGSTYIKIPGSSSGQYKEFEVNSSGDLVSNGKNYSMAQFRSRPIVRPLLRVPSSGKSPSNFLGITKYKSPMRHVARSSSTCGSSLSEGGTPSASVETSLVGAPAEIFDQSAAASPVNQITQAPQQATAQAPQQAPPQSQAAVSSQPFADFSSIRTADQVATNLQYQQQLIDFIKQSNQSPQEPADHSPDYDRGNSVDFNPYGKPDFKSGLNHDGSYSTIGAGSVARSQHRNRVQLEAQEIADALNRGYQNTKQAISTEVDFIKKDLAIAADGGYFRYAPEIAAGAAEGIGDGGVFIADAAVNGVAGNIKRAGQIIASPVTGTAFEDTSSTLSESLSQSAADRAEKLNNTSGLPAGTIARGSANVGVQAGTAVLASSPQLIGRVGQGLFILSDAADVTVGSAKTAQNIADDDLVGAAGNALGTAFSSGSVVNGLRTIRPNAKIVVDPELKIRGEDIDINAPPRTAGKEPEIEIVDSGNPNASGGRVVDTNGKIPCAGLSLVDDPCAGLVTSKNWKQQSHSGRASDLAKQKYGHQFTHKTKSPEGQQEIADFYSQKIANGEMKRIGTYAGNRTTDPNWTVFQDGDLTILTTKNGATIHSVQGNDYDKVRAILAGNRVGN